MPIFLDTADVNEIKRFHRMGIIRGVTTNPTILLKEGVRGGMKALETVKDPLTGEAFEFSRVQLEGVDRGFKLKCKERFRDFDEVAIFIEKPGRAINVVGKNAGMPR